MAKQITYREQEKIQNTIKLREFLSELPPYAKDYFRAKEPTTSDKTRLSYAYDLRVFFRFLQESNPNLKEKQISEISLSDLSALQPVDFEEFEELKNYFQKSKGWRCGQFLGPKGTRRRKTWHIRNKKKNALSPYMMN